MLDYYDNFHTIIKNICFAVKLGQSVVGTSMIICYKYILNLPEVTEEASKHFISLACIFISTKICNKLIRLEDLVKVMLSLYYKSQTNIAVEHLYDISEKIFLLEFEILNSIGFDLNIELPYKYLLQMKNYFSNYLKPHHDKLFELCCFYINDSFTLPVSLYYNPLLIALGCVNLLKQNLKINLVDTKEGVKWFNLICDTVDLNELEKLSQIINKIYTIKNKGENKEKSKEIIKFTDFLNSNDNTQFKCNHTSKEDKINYISPSFTSKDSLSSTNYQDNYIIKKESFFS